MSILVKSEAVTLLSATESTLGTQPTSGWRQHQPNAGGLTDMRRKIKKVARAPLSKNRQNEKGDVVDEDSTPKLVHDFTKDLVDDFCEGIFLAKTKHTGGTGVAIWQNVPVAPGAVVVSAVTGTAYTVASGGALTQNTLVFGRGFGIPGNNGLHAVGAASTGTSIVAAGTTAEASPPITAQLEVAGWRGASGDIGLDVNGNLTSTAADFTTMGLVVGMWLWVGGDPANATLNFATAAYRGFAKIVTIAAHLLTLERRSWTVGAADTGAAKTIDLYWGRFLRNVAIDNADYLEPSYQLELSLPGAATAGATAYKYMQGAYVGMFEVNAPLASLITGTVSFVGARGTDPGTSRATGASTANAPLQQQGVNTTSQLLRAPAIHDPGNANAVIAGAVSSWKLTLNNNVTPQKQQGTLGAATMVAGKCVVGLDLEVFYVQTDVEVAIGDNRTLNFDVGLRNSDGGVLFDIPSFMLDEGDLKFPANGPVTLSPKAEAFRDTTYSVTLGMMVFPYLPAS